MTHSTLTVTVRPEGVGFLLDRLGQDCGPLQHIRELTQNSIESLTRNNLEGEVLWDVDEMFYGSNKLMKLSVTDNGVGMDKFELTQYINQLSSSGGVQSVNGNYGLGAKISAATKNHFGVIYQSWKNGEGHVIWFWKDPLTGMYGLKPLDNGEFVNKLDASAKPKIIDKHGTRVILLGNAEEDDTMEPPAGVTPASKWVRYYLNMRYFRLPSYVKIRAREGWRQIATKNPDIYTMRETTGMEKYLNSPSNKLCNGVKALNGAKAHWWILKKDRPAPSDVNPGGHIAALYQNELYELRTGKSGISSLNRFGIIFEMRNVVIYVEPISPNLTTDTARTSLRMLGEPLPWDEWAEEFRGDLPQELIDLQQEDYQNSSSEDRKKSLLDKLRKFADMYNLKNLAVDPLGKKRAGDNNIGLETGSGGSVTPDNGNVTPGAYRKPRGVVGENILKALSSITTSIGVPASEVLQEMNAPDVVWIDLPEDHGLEGYAAIYLSATNTFKMNRKFVGFVDLIDYFLKEYKSTRGTPVFAVISESVETWFEFTMLDAYMGLQGLKKHDDKVEARDILTPECLTVIAMQRYHQTTSIKRDIGAKIGSIQ